MRIFRINCSANGGLREKKYESLLCFVHVKRCLSEVAQPDDGFYGKEPYSNRKLRASSDYLANLDNQN